MSIYPPDMKPAGVRSSTSKENIAHRITVGNLRKGFDGVVLIMLALCAFLAISTCRDRIKAEHERGDRIKADFLSFLEEGLKRNEEMKTLIEGHQEAFKDSNSAVKTVTDKFEALVALLFQYEKAGVLPKALSQDAAAILRGLPARQNITPDLGVPPDVFIAIKQRAVEKWPNEYSMQEWQIKEEVKSYNKVNVR